MTPERFFYFNALPPENGRVEDPAIVEEVQKKKGRVCFDCVPIFQSSDGKKKAGLLLRRGFFPGPWLAGSGVEQYELFRRGGPAGYAKYVLERDLRIVVTDEAEVFVLHNRFLLERDRPIPETLLWRAVVIDTDPTTITPSDKYEGFVAVGSWTEVEKLLRRYGRTGTLQHRMLFDLWEELRDLGLVG